MLKIKLIHLHIFYWTVSAVSFLALILYMPLHSIIKNLPEFQTYTFIGLLISLIFCLPQAFPFFVFWMVRKEVDKKMINSKLRFDLHVVSLKSESHKSMGWGRVTIENKNQSVEQILETILSRESEIISTINNPIQWSAGLNLPPEI